MARRIDSVNPEPLVVLVVTSIIAVPLIGAEGAGIALALRSLMALFLLVSLGQKYLPLRISRSFIAKWICAVVALMMLNATLTSLDISSLMTGTILSCVFLAFIKATCAHSLEDIKQMIRLLRPEPRE